MLEKPQFIQGVFSFEGRGLERPGPLGKAASYKAPFDKRSQVVYFRAGNSSEEMIYLLLLRDGKPMRYFPVGAKAATHVALAVTEDLHPDTSLEVHVAAPEGTRGSVVLDVGFTEF